MIIMLNNKNVKYVNIFVIVKYCLKNNKKQ